MAGNAAIDFVVKRIKAAEYRIHDRLIDLAVLRPKTLVGSLVSLGAVATLIVRHFL